METDAERKIIEAAIECIESEGLEGTTIRKIAANAGVNSAAINYYFRSKDALLRRALNRSLENAFDWEDFGASHDASPEERLSHVMSRLMQGACRFPNLSRAHLDVRPAAAETRRAALDALKEFFGHLEDDLIARGISIDRESLRKKIVHVFNATIIAAVFAPDLLAEHGGLEADDEDSRLGYVRSLVYPLLRE